MQSASFKKPPGDVKNKLTEGLQEGFRCASFQLHFVNAIFQSSAEL